MTNIDNQLDRLGDALHTAVAADLDPTAAGEAAGREAETPGRRRRGPRLALGAAVAVAAVTAAMIVSAGGDNAPAAYAVETKPGGGVTIKIYSLGEPEGVEHALAESGVASQVTYLEAGMACREPHYQPSMALLRTLQEGQPQPQPWAGFDYASTDGPMIIAIGDFQQRREMVEEIREAARQGDASGAEWPEFVIDPTEFRSDQTLIISSSPVPADYQQPVPPNRGDQGGFKTSPGLRPTTVGQVRVAEGRVGPCEPVPASNSPAPVRAPAGGWDFSEAEYAGWGFGLGPGGAE